MTVLINRLRKAEYLKSVLQAADLEECVAEAAFIGRSNVGKSTVLNAVCGKKGLAKTSQTAGRTRMINVFGVGPNKRVIDLPGYGFAAGPEEDRSAVPADVSRPERLVYDLVYRPTDTCLLRDARSRGARTLGGLPMLIYQGAASFKIWTGRDAPVDVMFAAGRQALGVD